MFLVDIKNRPLGDRNWRFGRYLKLAAELVSKFTAELVSKFTKVVS